MSRNKGDDRFFGAVLVGGLFGIVGAGAMHVAYGFGFASTVGLFALIAGVAALVLLLGWRDAPPPAPGPGTAPTVGSTGGAGWTAGMGSSSSKRSSGSGSSGAKASGASGEGDVALHTPTPAATSDHVSIDTTVNLHTPETEPLPVFEGQPERPSALDAPREGKADDLQRIKGVGPALEKLCHSLGFYHYDQIANWTDAEVAWVDQNLEGFKGRVTRDQWVAQAKDLAAQNAPA